jgi:hypothetical protein
MPPLTMRPTGGHSPVYRDRQDWTIFDDGKPVGRIYEDAGASTPAELALVLVDHGVCGPDGGHRHQREGADARRSQGAVRGVLAALAGLGEGYRDAAALAAG